MDCRDRAAHGERLDSLYLWRCSVRLVVRRGRSHDTAQPRRSAASDRRDSVVGRYGQHDVAGAVEPARSVAFDDTGHPRAAAPRLPDDRRAVGIDSVAFDVAVDTYDHDVVRSWC